MRVTSRTLLALIIVVTTSSVLFGAAFIQEFLAKSESGNVILEWWTGQEDNVKSFTVERKSGTSSLFQQVGELVPPKGSNSHYVFVDESAFKSTDSFYVYRIKISDNDGKIGYSREVGVSHTVSSVKRTWGSIKAMFR